MRYCANATCVANITRVISRTRARAKFKPIIDGYKRKGEFSDDTLGNWEYLANEMAGISMKMDKDWKTTPSAMSKEDFNYAYRGKTSTSQ